LAFLSSTLTIPYIYTLVVNISEMPMCGPYIQQRTKNLHE
jgi:hypothetical protein